MISTGILLTGLHTTSDRINTHLLDLLQNYVDRTADVQAASAIAVVTRNPQIINHERTQRWIECYRGLLNQWRLWTERYASRKLIVQLDPLQEFRVVVLPGRYLIVRWPHPWVGACRRRSGFIVITAVSRSQLPTRLAGGKLSVPCHRFNG